MTEKHAARPNSDSKIPMAPISLTTRSAEANCSSCPNDSRSDQAPFTITAPRQAGYVSQFGILNVYQSKAPATSRAKTASLAAKLKVGRTVSEGVDAASQAAATTTGTDSPISQLTFRSILALITGIGLIFLDSALERRLHFRLPEP